MKSRVKKDHRYVGRIFICERWLSFKNFCDDMGPKPVGLTLERKNNDGNYEPENCCWASQAEQNKNTRNCKPITYNGEIKLFNDWADELGFNKATVLGLIRKGVPFEEAIKIKKMNGGIEVNREKDDRGKSIHATRVGRFGGLTRGSRGKRGPNGKFIKEDH